MHMMPDIEWVTWCDGEKIGGCHAVATITGSEHGLIGLLFAPGTMPPGLRVGSRLTIKGHRANSVEADVWVKEWGNNLVACSLREPGPPLRTPGLLDFLR